MGNGTPQRNYGVFRTIFLSSAFLVLMMFGACSEFPIKDNQVSATTPPAPILHTIRPNPMRSATPLVTPTILPMVAPNAISTPTCSLPPITIPTLPAEIPADSELDSATGLHVTGRVSEIDLTSYRLEVTGKVDHPLSLSYDDMRCMPKIEKKAALICPGFFVDEATWAGASLEHILQLADVQPGATQIFLHAVDGYSTSVSLEEASFGENFLAYEWEGQPLPRLHGFPIRAVFPELQGNKWVKFLVKIDIH